MFHSIKKASSMIKSRRLVFVLADSELTELGVIYWVKIVGRLLAISSKILDNAEPESVW